VRESCHVTKKTDPPNATRGRSCDSAVLPIGNDEVSTGVPFGVMRRP
jgi:hypothetical protein